VYLQEVAELPLAENEKSHTSYVWVAVTYQIKKIHTPKFKKYKCFFIKTSHIVKKIKFREN